MAKEQITAENKTGWTRRFPDAHGDYWLRFTDPPSDACVVEVNGRGVFEAGVTGDIRNRVVIDECEWLGPISPSDTEQLVRLREAANDADEALQLIQGFDWQLDSSTHGQEIRRRATGNQHQVGGSGCVTRTNYTGARRWANGSGTRRFRASSEERRHRHA